CQNLLRERIDTATGFAGAYRTKNGNAGEESPLGDREPRGMLRGAWHVALVYLADDQAKIVAVSWKRIGGQTTRPQPRGNLDCHDVESGEQDGIENEGCGVEEKDVGEPRPKKDG